MPMCVSDVYILHLNNLNSIPKITSTTSPNWAEGWSTTQPNRNGAPKGGVQHELGEHRI